VTACGLRRLLIRLYRREARLAVWPRLRVIGTYELRGTQARTAFVSSMDLGLLTGAVIAIAGCLLALAWLPARSGEA
jgi:hypothetical protein